MSIPVKRSTLQFNRRFLPACLFLCFALVCSLTALADRSNGNTQLVMIEEPGCVYCAKFNREIAPAYAQTPEGKTAPLRRLNLHDPWPDDLSGVKGETVTPTFILVHNNTEIGRLRGYQGDEFFWFLLNELLSKLPVTGADQ